jgi:hypothetical protein
MQRMRHAQAMLDEGKRIFRFELMAKEEFQAGAGT